MARWRAYVVVPCPPSVRRLFCYAMSMRQKSCFAGGLIGLHTLLLAMHFYAMLNAAAMKASWKGARSKSAHIKIHEATDCIQHACASRYLFGWRCVVKLKKKPRGRGVLVAANQMAQ